MKKNILDRIFEFFINSRDYNGIPLGSLRDEFCVDITYLIEIIKELIQEGEVSIQSSTNPHIIRSSHFTIESQLKVLDNLNEIKINSINAGKKRIDFVNGGFYICLYPSKELLLKKRDISQISDYPYTLELALAEPQLKPKYFDIEVLERYRIDPRYSFKFESYYGSISCLCDEFDNPYVREEDRIFIKTFGLGYDESRNRLIVVYLRYLNNLTREHQVYWQSKEAKNEGMMTTAYFNNTNGQWSKNFSIYSAFVYELKALNDLSEKIFKKRLFIKDFCGENKPKDLNFLYLPTFKNYYEFILLLDKMLSENINRDFFKEEVELYEIHSNKDGSCDRITKGTIRLLEEWLLVKYEVTDHKKIKELFQSIKSVRKQRQQPAHKIDENNYNANYNEIQKSLMSDLYDSIRTLRRIFQKHPKSKGVHIPDWLDKGSVFNY